MSMCNLTACVTLRLFRYADLQTLYRTTKICHHDNVASKIFFSSLLLYSFYRSRLSNPTYSNTNTPNPNRFHANSNTIHPINYLPTSISPGPSSPRNLPHQLRLVLWCTLSRALKSLFSTFSLSTLNPQSHLTYASS